MIGEIVKIEFPGAWAHGRRGVVTAIDVPVEGLSDVYVAVRIPGAAADLLFRAALLVPVARSAGRLAVKHEDAALPAQGNLFP